VVMTNGKPKSRPAKPPVHSRELVQKVRELISGATATKPAALLRMLRVGTVGPWNRDDVTELARLLESVDPDWSLRLQVLQRGLPTRRGEFSTLLHDAISRGAQQTTSYPSTPANASEAEGAFTAWALGSLNGTPGAPPSAIVAAIWPDRKAAWFPQVALAILSAWSTKDKARRKTDIGGLTVRMFTTPSGRSRAAELAAMLAPTVARRDEAIASSKEATAMAERARHARFGAEEDLRRVRTEIDTLGADLRAATGSIEQLRQELERVEMTAANDLLAATTRAANEASKQKATVVGVLSHELEQIRLYLERANPNVGDAIARLRYLDQLRVDLERRD
jgi:hypothetical protein